MVEETVDFRPGDTIADIGTADGWFAAALSVYSDSLVFYLEDIDSTLWNRQRFDAAVKRFSLLSKTNGSHQYHYVKGTETSTELPEKKFHTVLIIDTFHHFNNPDEMLSDVVALLKPGGKIAILEALARKPGDIHHGCGSRIFSESEIASRMRSHGMELSAARFIHKVAGRRNQLFIFTAINDN
jgi:ubiquinone/menaquinone biosynthesis C-methylase UbiE